MGFSRQEYWSGLPFPPPGDLPDPGIKLTSLALAGRFFTTEPPGNQSVPPPKDHHLSWARAGPSVDPTGTVKESVSHPQVALG